jgi:release factor glutamine methyltransferase
VTLRQALTRARQMLAAAGVENPVLESEVLLKHLLKTDRVYLYLEPATSLAEDIETAFFQGIDRLSQGEPLAYIIRSREFYGLDFYIDSRVLIPRPETELIVEEAIHFAQNRPVRVAADIGTGSGVIAVNLAKSLPGLNKIYATDISAPALEVANINCQKHNVSGIVTLLQGDLLEPLPEPVDLLAANLPYVKRGDMYSMPSARFEPHLALDGGEGGLDSLSRFCARVDGKIRSGGCLLLEIGLGQGKEVSALLQNRFPDTQIDIIPDLAGIERVARVTIKV